MQSHPRPWWHEWEARSDRNERVNLHRGRDWHKRQDEDPCIACLYFQTTRIQIFALLYYISWVLHTDPFIAWLHILCSTHRFLHCLSTCIGYYTQIPALFDYISLVLHTDPCIAWLHFLDSTVCRGRDWYKNKRRRVSWSDDHILNEESLEPDDQYQQSRGEEVH